ncbi:ArnT family glycosyltransferase [Lewinella sp. IMCC34183]|uniref:ArnT family glycosyltransferase n=1 Tax=Lewinella sp. IMCC34183 TaxID=2248762 RepID=UPI000E23AD4F|nr:glycosyltransferase family 39 protein [Lewinella sp. IMCC34183]
MPFPSSRITPRLPAEALLWGLLILFTIFSCYRLGSWGLIETSEARYAEMGREMLQHDDYLHPTIVGLRHYHKPPLTYAITATAYRIFGVGPGAARFFLQVGLLLQLLLVYRIGRRLLPDPRQPLWATAVYASFPILLIASRNLTTDLYLMTFLLAGVYAFVRSEQGNRPVGWLLLAYLAWGLAALTKGAGVVILPAVLLPAWYLLHPPANWLTLIGRHLLGVLVFLPVGLSWYLALIAEDASLVDYFLVDQTIRRYTSDQWGREMPAWFYLATVTATTLPWLPAVLGYGRSWSRLWRERAVVYWAAAWFVGPIVFYSFAHSKLLLYVLPAYPGLALLAAVWLAAAGAGAVRNWMRIAQVSFSLLFVGLLAAPLITDRVTGSVLYYLFAALGLVAFWYVPPRLSGLARNGAERLVAVPLLFTTFLLPVGTEFLAANELLVSSPAPVVRELRDRGLADYELYTLNRELPAVAFGLNTEPHYLYQGPITRDTSREVTGEWRRHWLPVDHTSVRDSLMRRWATQPAVVVVYGNARFDLAPWLEQLGNHDTLGRYTFYYGTAPDRD